MGVQVRQRPPLDRFCCFETTDVDEARQIVSRHFCSHRLDPGPMSDRFDACQNRVSGQHVSLNYIRYGADVTIEPGELTDFYLIQIPIKGHADITNGRSEVASSPRLASVLNPDRHTKMHWHASCEQILLQIDQAYLQSVAEKIAGVPLGRVRFAAALDLKIPEVFQWNRRLRGLFGAAQEERIFDKNDKQCQRMLEETLVASLLTCQPNTASSLLERRETGAAPAKLRRAISFIGDRFQDDIGLLDICSHAGTTPRNLQLLFKREFGAGPVQVLHDMRLAYARHLLVTDGGNWPIAEIADMSGHRHFGRFSVAYKNRYGETPRQTKNRDTFG